MRLPQRFYQAASDVRKWLRSVAGSHVSSRNRQEWKRRGYPKSWCVPLEIEGGAQDFYVLLPPNFPFARPRIAIDRDLYMKWPHVEDNNLLCLPASSFSATDPVGAVQQAIHDSQELFKFTEEVVREEFEREFVSYWNRQPKLSDEVVASLLTATGDTRVTAVWKAGQAYLVAETEAVLKNWIGHRNPGHAADDKAFSVGLFCSLDRPPVPSEFPNSAAAVGEFLKIHSPDGLALFEELLRTQSHIVIVFRAETVSGSGLGAITVEIKKNLKLPGFRKGRVPPKVSAVNWRDHSVVNCHRVRRYNHSWIHGREKDEDARVLQGKRIAVVGCGALGSHVAVGLGLAGAGGFVLADPETFETQNAGRHVLGVEYAGINKARALSENLGKRLPHLSEIEALPKRIEQLTDDEWERVQSCDIIVSATGDWAVDGFLNVKHLAANCVPPVVYGWLEEYGAASHAVAVQSNRSCLRCLLDADGTVKSPETLWPNSETSQLPEPACGVAFQPFGAIDLGYGASLVTELCVDILLGAAEGNRHRIYATSQVRMEKLGGHWTDYHSASRPNGFTGSFVRDDELTADPHCPDCKHDD